jgi:acetyl-CoA carboxylase/biotin carboxylase 1
MAATKAIMSMRNWSFMELGFNALEFVAMASKEDLDANAEFIRLADSYVEVPGGKNTFNYANVDLICETARKQKVHAVWPGWGHASEVPALPRKLNEMGITFLGPTASVMYILGDKIASSILAQTSGVPTIPWSGDGLRAELLADGTISDEIFRKACVETLEEALTQTARIGYPCLLKASEGGGGKGIRKVGSAEECKVAFEQIRTEVAGSPIFVMQLCGSARHLEVQLVGDEHGSVVALCGRDCSTQRRFQKIFEEAPPLVCPKDTFRKMEVSAMKLASDVGYRGAGTVEFLFMPASNTFAFLELNPRLQVEHPCTEGITGANMPSVQLMVGMGIPLSRIPDIRRFYGLDSTGSEPIDFINTQYPYPKVHVCAARITAENPDDSFRPTSGKIERVKFQSGTNLWGYFSVGANGAIHEYADSQFGHIFAKGENREQARKTMQMGLRNIEIFGEIRNPVEYLVELAETDAYKQNTIDTAWLDRLIAEKSVRQDVNFAEAVFYAASFRAHQHVKEQSAAILDGLERGHLPLKSQLTKLKNFTVEVAYEGTKYMWKCARTREDSFALTVGESTIDARIREQADGSLYVQQGDRVTHVRGTEESLGLRLTMTSSSNAKSTASAATLTFPNLRDPSELRSEFNGKVVRYLHSDGADVEKDEPYVELEAMKMIMSLRSSEAGKIQQSLSPGSIVSPGQLLATLKLRDPGSVQTVQSFSGEYPLLQKLGRGRSDSSVAGAAQSKLEKALAAHFGGYAISASEVSTSGTALVQALFTAEPQFDLQATVLSATRLLGAFLSHEAYFAGLVGGDETQIIAKFEGSSKELFSLLCAHHALSQTVETAAALLRTLKNHVPELGSGSGIEELVAMLKQASALPAEGGYGEVALLAAGLAEKAVGTKTNVGARVTELQDLLSRSTKRDLKDMASGEEAAHTMTALVKVIATPGSASGVQEKALELFFRRLNSAHIMSDFEAMQAQPAMLGMLWSFGYPGSTAPDKQGCALVLKDVAALAALRQSWPAQAKAHELHLIIAEVPVPEMMDPVMQQSAKAKIIDDVSSFVKSIAAKLAETGCLELSVTLAHATERPTFLHYRAPAWTEVPISRNLRPSHSVALEFYMLEKEYDTLVPVHSTRRSALVLGTKNQVETLLVRSVTALPVQLVDLERTIYERFLECLDNIERADMDPTMRKKGCLPASRIFFHVMSPIVGCTERDMKLLRAMFDSAVKRRMITHAARILKNQVEAIDVKVWTSADGAGGRPSAVRLFATADQGWECVALREQIGENGRAVAWTDVDTGEVRTDLYAMTTLEMKLMGKRSVARRANSTYVFDFLGLFRNALVQQWVALKNDAPESIQRSSKTLADPDLGKDVPEKIFVAKELALQNGKLVEVDRPVGQNDVGMVAWLCTMKTPEYPEGREMMLIGSDITLKAGSFGTIEDEVFCQASQIARAKGIPRIYIACNSGARLGGVEEIKPLIKVAWENPAEPQRGFEYLYITDEAKKSLPPKAVQTHEKSVNGEVRHVLDAIVGLDLASIKGGIGVENLQGSGMIAGETSRAYDETFTLSYVTGRSVGIGAYLNRLGQRNIQMVKGPMILTGFQALNKLLGQQVYTTQDQLGGPHIMVPNGVTHELVGNDQSGVEAILRWLSFIPCTTSSIQRVMQSKDPISREVGFAPSKEPYDPRHLFTGARVSGEWLPGFCDDGTFHEYMEGWGKTVVVGRGRVGGLPVGIIAVETRSVQRHIPADPADMKSREIVEAQAGQVWFPDSAYKTAQAIRDFNRSENLPLIIFANWRGFSGGTRDMFAEILKYGSMIVDALVEYKHPITIYIPPHGELRGGAWVVLDPKINPENMEMYADQESRGGILEPPAACDLLWKEKQIYEMMHRNDSTLIALDAKAKVGQDVSAEMQAREKLLLPLYTQVAVAYCDLHDTPGRMQAVGAIREALTWRTSRAYLHWRIRRRIQETAIGSKLRQKVPTISSGRVAQFLGELRAAAGTEADQGVAEWFEANSDLVDRKVGEMQETAMSDELYRIFQSLSASKRADVMRDLDGFNRVNSAMSP